MSSLRSRLAKAIQAVHAPPRTTITAIQDVIAKRNGQTQISVMLRIFDMADAKTRTGQVNGKRVYLIDEDSAASDMEDLRTLNEYDRREFCLSVMVFANLESSISHWKVGDVVKLLVKDLKLYDNKQCQALFVEAQDRQPRSNGNTVDKQPNTETTTKQNTEQLQGMFVSSYGYCFATLG
jgi:hypothetical protein